MVNAKNKKTLIKVEDYINNPSVYSYPDSIQHLISLFNYSPVEINLSILDKIVDGSFEKLIMSKDLLKKLRRLKRGFTATNKTLFYLDEFWNTNTASLFISSNLGDYMGNQPRKLTIEYNPDERFKTTLIMQNAFTLDYVNKIDRNITRSKEAIRQIQNLSLHD